MQISAIVSGDIPPSSDPPVTLATLEAKLTSVLQAVAGHPWPQFDREELEASLRQADEMFTSNDVYDWLNLG